VEIAVEGLAVPIMGFYDFEWAQHDLLTDLKSTYQLPSANKLPHARQVSLYKKCREVKTASLTYVTPKKSAMYELEEAEAHFNALVKTALAVQKFLSISKDPMELASMVVPDVDSFYYNDPVTRQWAFEIWGV
jgi:hypothetical protein